MLRNPHTQTQTQIQNDKVTQRIAKGPVTVTVTVAWKGKEKEGKGKEGKGGPPGELGFAYVSPQGLDALQLCRGGHSCGPLALHPPQGFVQLHLPGLRLREFDFCRRHRGLRVVPR
jgi:hypothetical protein